MGEMYLGIVERWEWIGNRKQSLLLSFTLVTEEPG